MPLYEFRCDTCGQRFERLLWREPDPSSPGAVPCGCGSPQVERVPYSRTSLGPSASNADACRPQPGGGGCCGGGCQRD